MRYLGDPKSTVLIIGYQSSGTLGRKLYRGDKDVDVLGEHIQVKANVTSIGAYSAHADQNMLLKWVNDVVKKPSHIYCTHGDEGASAALATRIQQKLNIPCDVPRYEDVLSI